MSIMELDIRRNIEMGRKFGFSFSWKRATGISGAKSRISRKIGIPLTRQGRQRKVGRVLGCCIPAFLFILLTGIIVLFIVLLIF